MSDVNRHRRVRLETDQPDVYRTAREFDAVATVTVGAADGTPARTYDDASVRLTVRSGGEWEVAVAGPGWGSRPVTVAEGHIDHIPVVSS